MVDSSGQMAAKEPRRGLVVGSLQHPIRRNGLLNSVSAVVKTRLIAPVAKLEVRFSESQDELDLPCFR